MARRRLRSVFRTVTEHRADAPVADSADPASRRVAAMPTSELIPWAEQSLYAVGRALSHYQREGNADWLADAALEGENLRVILGELTRRVS